MPRSTIANNPSAMPFKYTVPFSAAVNAALLEAAARDHMEPTEVIQRATISALTEKGFLKKADADQIRLFWALVDRTVEKAMERCLVGKFASSIALDAIQDCMADPVLLQEFPFPWLEGYRQHIGDDVFKHGNPKKGPINREIGYRIRAAIDGKVEKSVDGKPKMVKVLGEIIQSYTAMKSYNKALFKPHGTDL